MAISYTPTTNFGAKDTLPTNDPDKVVKGTEFTTEFTAIQSAFQLAAPAASPTFTGTATFDDVTSTGTVAIADADITTLDVTGTATLTDADVTTLDVTGAFTSRGIDDNATSTAVTIDSSGNVGIGETNPATALHLGVGGKLRLERPDGATYSDIYMNSGGAGGLEFLNNNNDGFTFSFASGGDQMVIDNSGNVGIGTASPSGGLHVKSSTDITTFESTTNGLYNTFTSTAGTFGYLGSGSQTVSGAANTDFGIQATIGNFVLATGGNTERMRIDSSGNVGIGTSSPGALGSGSWRGLDIQGQDTTTGGSLKLSNSDESTLGYLYTIGSDNSMIMRTVTNTPIEFWTNNTRKMTLDSAGNLLVGRTTPIGSGGHSFQSNSTMDFYLPTALTTAGLVGFYSDVGGTQSIVAQILTDGDVQNTNNSYGAISDIAYKENIVDASPQLDDIMGMRVRSYNLKSTGEKHIGVIAQELEETSPELVKTGEDGMKSVKYSVMYMKAIKALQEAVTRIETLEAEVAALKGA